MEAVLEIIILFFTFVFEVVLLALQLLVALIIPSRRGSLKDKWQSSRLKRVEIIFSVVFISIVFGLLIYFLTMMNGCSNQKQTSSSNSYIKLNENSDTDEGSIKIEVSEEVKDKAIDYLKEKWKNRKAE